MLSFNDLLLIILSKFSNFSRYFQTLLRNDTHVNNNKLQLNSVNYLIVVVHSWKMANEMCINT